MPRPGRRPRSGPWSGAAVGLAAAWLIVGRRGQLDGDGLGASVELSFAAVVVATALVAAVLRTHGSGGLTWRDR